MQIGDLVKYVSPHDTERRTHETGIVVRIDAQYYGSTTAYQKNPKSIERPRRISNVPDMIAETAGGIQNRVLVYWSGDIGYLYQKSGELELI